MDQAAEPRQVEPKAKFIQRDPTSSQYNGRITKDDEAMLAALLPTLHFQGVNREQMLVECNAVLGTPITFAQLDRQRAKFRLHKYRRQRPTLPSQTQRFHNIAPQSYDEEHVGGLGSGTESETIGVCCANQLQHVGTSNTLQMENAPRLTNTAMLDDPYNDHGGAAPQPGPITDLILSNVGTSPDLETCRASLSFLGSDPALFNTHVPKPLQSDMTDHRSAVRPPSRFKLICNHPLQRKVFIYHIHSESLMRIYLEQLGSGAAATNIAHVAQIATLLHTVKAFDQAFDLFCMLFANFHINTSIRYRHLHMTFAAIACAQSAQSDLQFRVAYGMIQCVYGGVAPLTPVDSFSSRVKSTLADLGHRLESVISGGTRRLQPGILEGVIFGAFAVLGFSHSVTRHNPLSKEWDPQSGPGDLLHVAFSDEFLGDCFLDGMEIALSILEEQLDELDVLTKDAWKFLDTTATSIARRLACTVLKAYARRGAARAARATERFPGGRNFRVRWTIVTVALAPFVLLSKTGRVGNMVEFIEAARQYQRGILSNPARLDELGRSCRLQLLLLAVESPYDALSPSPDEVVEICASVARVTIPSDDFAMDMSPPRLDKAIPSLEEEFLLGICPSQHQYSHVPIPPSNLIDASLLEQVPAPSSSLLSPLSEVALSGVICEQSSVLTPALARTYTPSNSSSLRSFLSTAERLRRRRTRFSDDGLWQDAVSESGTSHSSWRFSFMSNAPPSTFSTRRSVQTVLSDIEMTG
ncbi:hypothetical protein G647_07104 [Cladophialophora carrionii CBS 160.54]|uniref:Uncharacterized protein n=1 Tax=Cladophialophora carrionii CBS 160.54 TaxID=1279043 RepID=V9D437_9EURO|nr:uncharacterized protein G647_07104 [Cladophialophora carrionii CBS 160.54]ETI20762.1 hypothetical protein G647_07104 [Cladophialophora carrionii CBS 160.54]